MKNKNKPKPAVFTKQQIKFIHDFIGDSVPQETIKKLKDGSNRKYWKRKQTHEISGLMYKIYDKTGPSPRLVSF